MIDFLLLILLMATVIAAAIDHRKYRQTLARAELLVKEAEDRASVASESVNREIVSLSQTFESKLPEQLREAMQPLYGAVADLQNSLKSIQSPPNPPHIFGFSFPESEDKTHD